MVCCLPGMLPAACRHSCAPCTAPQKAPTCLTFSGFSHRHGRELASIQLASGSAPAPPAAPPAALPAHYRAWSQAAAAGHQAQARGGHHRQREAHEAAGAEGQGGQACGGWRHGGRPAAEARQQSDDDGAGGSEVRVRVCAGSASVPDGPRMLLLQPGRQQPRDGDVPSLPRSCAPLLQPSAAVKAPG